MPISESNYALALVRNYNDILFFLKFINTIVSNLIASCISGDSSHCTEKKSDFDTVSYTKKTVALPSVSYTQDVTKESNFIEEIHNAERQTKDGDRIHSSEIDRLSLANRNLSDQLQSVRNQLSSNLNRLRDFEERVKMIPKLQLELSVEKAENRDMHLKLKTLENVLEKEEHNVKEEIPIDDFSNNAESTKPILYTPKPFNAHRVCATSLESLNVRLPFTSSPAEPLQQLHKSVSCLTKTQPSTHNVGCMTTETIKRDVGVVTLAVHVPTKCIAINTDISQPTFW